MKPAWRNLLFLCCLTATLGCQRGTATLPSGIIDRETMISILTDVHVTDAILHEENINPADKNKMAAGLYPYITSKYDVTRAEIDSSLYYYNQNPADFSKMYDEVLKKVNQKLSTEKEQNKSPHINEEY